MLRAAGIVLLIAGTFWYLQRLVSAVSLRLIRILWDGSVVLL